jgi:type VI secretion system protein ImpB
MPEPANTPRERVTIVYQAAVGGAREEKELPLKLLVLADFSGQRSSVPLEERVPTPVAKERFDEVLASHGPALALRVPDRLGAAGGEIDVRLEFSALADFTPDALVRRVPQLARLLAVRDALSALKGPLGNIPAFRRRIQELVAETPANPALLDDIRAARDA